MMKELGLKEGDLDDVIVEEEEPLPYEATRWMAIARVHTEKSLQPIWVLQNHEGSMGLSATSPEPSSGRQPIHHAILLFG